MLLKSAFSLNLWTKFLRMRFFQDFCLPLFFRSIYANTTWCLSHWLPLLRGSQTKPSAWFGCPLLLSGVLSHLWDTHCMFTTCFSGHLHWAQAETRSSILAGKMEPSRAGWGDTGGGWSQIQCRWGDISITNHFWSTYLNRSPSDMNRVRMGIGRAVLFCNLHNIHKEKSDFKTTCK